MPYHNNYNENIARRVRSIDKRHIDRINQISETNNFDVATPLESMTLRNENVSGGSGFAAATVADLGFEPTDGATHTNGATGGRIRKKRATTNLSGKGTSGGALLTTQSADAVLRPQPPPQPQIRTSLQASPHKDQPFPQPSRGSAINGALAGSGQSGGGTSGGGTSGGGQSGGGTSGGVRTKRAPTARNELVRKVMREQGLSLPAASAYIKKNGLQYK